VARWELSRSINAASVVNGHWADAYPASRSVVISPADRRAWSEAAGELRYLSIRLQGYVAELPNQSLPPRGRVPWSPAELGELGVLTRAVARGEDDASRAVASLDAIDTLFRRGHVGAAAADSADTGDPAVADRLAEGALLGHYLAQRAIAMDSLHRLQRLGDPAPDSMRNARPPRAASGWQLFWARTLAKVRARRPL
jgi:hypothetical protein